jgi:hypothetical protein
MKKFYLFLFITCSMNFYSQQLILDENIKDDIELFRYKLLPISENIIIAKSSKKNSSQFVKYFNDIYLVDDSKNIKDLNNNFLFKEYSISPVSDQIRLMPEFKNFSDDSKNCFIDKNGISKVVDLDDKSFNKMARDLFTSENYFVFFNKKNKLEINLKNDNILFSKTNFTTKKSNTVNIPNINTERLLENNYSKIKRPAFTINLLTENQIEIITKHVSKDFASTTLYRTVYDYDGKKLSEFNYLYNCKLGILRYSINTSSEKNRFYTSNQIEGNIPVMDLDINDYYVDLKTNDLYLYGLYGKKGKGAYGFYLLKFKDDGTLIYEKIIEIDDKKGLNKQSIWLQYSIKMKEYKNNLVLTIIGANAYNNDNHHIYEISKETGEKLSYSILESKSHSSKGSFIRVPENLTIFEINEFSKNKFVSRDIYTAVALNKKVEEYILSDEKKVDVFYDCFITKKGIWLFETDNDNYFKTLFFN